MKSLTIFGKNHTIIEQRSDKDSVHIQNNKILITSCKRPASSLLKEFLTDLLYSQLLKIHDQIKKKEIVDVFGDLDFEIVEKIDNKKQRVAKLKGNKILVKLNAVMLPKPLLEYIIAHEMAHIVTKRHTERFWKTVELMCPNFQKNRELLTKYGHSIIGESIPEN